MPGLTSLSAEVLGLLESMNAVHGFHKLKKYRPPVDITPSLSFQCCCHRMWSSKRLFDPIFQSEVDACKRIFELFKQIFSKKRSVQEQAEDAKSSIASWIQQ